MSRSSHDLNACIAGFIVSDIIIRYLRHPDELKTLAVFLSLGSDPHLLADQRLTDSKTGLYFVRYKNLP